jgi:hypothetical protein
MNNILSAASMRRGKWSAYARMKVSQEDAIVAAIRAAKIQPVARARFVFTWVEPNMRRDKDNIVAARKFILDALVAAGILQDDGWPEVVGWTDHFQVDRLEPGVRVYMEGTA